MMEALGEPCPICPQRPGSLAWVVVAGCCRPLSSPLPQFTNRCLLKWLKLWDPVVFGRERPARKPRPSEPARASKEAPGATGKWKSHEQVLEEMLEAELEPGGRPRQKVRPGGRG